MNLTANEKKSSNCPAKTICSAVGGYAGTFVYHYSTLILGGILSAYTSAGTKCIFIKIWF